MDMQASVILRNMPEDTPLDTVERTLRVAVCEWLDYDRHPDDIKVSLGYVSSPKTAPGPSGREDQRPIFCVSDLHLGDGGPRDNFAWGGKMRLFLSFLDYVERQNGRLFILGDLFEFWQANVSKAIMKHLWLLDRFATMGARYVLGNHDADLLHFCGKAALRHRFFDQMVPEHEEVVADKRIKFIHGHQADPYCVSDTPGMGRISAIYSGLREDRNGSPWINKYRTVEEATVGRMERALSIFYRLLGRSDRFREMNQWLCMKYLGYDMLVSGHTHRAGANRPWLYNTGTWAERVNSFVCINSEGAAGVFDWQNGVAVPNTTELSV